MTLSSLEPRLQLVPPGTQPRLWMFALCVVLPTLVTLAALLAVKQGDTQWDFAGGDPRVVGAAILGLQLLLLLALWAVLDRLMRRQRLLLSPTTLEVKTSFYTRRIAIAELMLDQARIIDLEERKEFRVGAKSNGYALPGFKSGHFRLRNGEKAFVAVAGERRALWIPCMNGAGLLLQPNQPDALLQRLRELAATPARR